MISKVARWYTHAHTPVQYYGDMIDLCALFALRKYSIFFSCTEYCCQNFSVSDVFVGLMMGILCSLISLPFSLLRM